MQAVATLVADPAAGPLPPAAVEAVRAALAASGAAPAAADWLAPGLACDIALERCPGPEAAAAAAAALAGLPVDLALLPAAGRRKRLLVADMDSTIVTGETLDELADFAGLRERIAAITARAMNGEIDFAAALRERVAMLAGLPATALERSFERVRLSPGARRLVRTMRAGGAHTILVSGGFRWFAERVAAAAGFDEAVANELLLADGRIAGRVAEPILGGRDKRLILERAAAARGLALADAAAVGDGANDLDMLQAAGLGVAYRAKPVVARAARYRVEHGDLTALLYFQGYRAAEIRS